MRIRTGKYKGRHFGIPRSFKARPTTDFAKENIFNVINGYVDMEGAQALDLFAGTGSISLELLSRGCAPVVSVEMDRDHAAFIRECMTKLDTKDNILIRAMCSASSSRASSSTTSSSPIRLTPCPRWLPFRSSSSARECCARADSSSSSMASITTSLMCRAS